MRREPNKAEPGKDGMMSAAMRWQAAGDQRHLAREIGPSARPTMGCENIGRAAVAACAKNEILQGRHRGDDPGERLMCANG